MSALYVHVPFCQHICSYCDFCKVFYDEKWAWDYLKALSFEIKDKALSTSYDSIYIGGGSFVHASGEGSGTVGQYPDQCVKTAPLSGYWERYVYNYRRLY